MKNIMLSSFAIIMLLTSCSAPMKTVRNARITTTDTRIVLNQSRKTLRSGVRFFPSNQSDFAFKGKALGKEILSVKDALKHGAEKISIHSPFAKRPLYGVLLSSKVKDCSNEPTTRSYEISIPSDFVVSAQGGLVSCRYEYYRCGSNNYTTWVLWISDIPF